MTYGLNWMKMVEEGVTRNCSRDDLDLSAENVCLVIELLLFLFCNTALNVQSIFEGRIFSQVQTVETTQVCLLL